MNRLLVPLLLSTACSLQGAIGTSGPASPTPPAAPVAGAGPVRSDPAPADPAPAPAAACDAARNHCLPDGTRFMQGDGHSGRRVKPCVERDGVWYTVAFPDIVCEGRTLHGTDPTAAITVGSKVISYTPSGREPDGVPENAQRAGHGLWSLQTVTSIDAAAGTYRGKGATTYRLAGTRLVVESVPASP